MDDEKDQPEFILQIDTIDNDGVLPNINHNFQSTAPKFAGQIFVNEDALISQDEINKDNRLLVILEDEVYDVTN